MFSREFIFIYGILYSSSEQPGGIASCTTMTVTLKPALNVNLPPMSEGRMSMIGRAYVCKGLALCLYIKLHLSQHHTS